MDGWRVRFSLGQCAIRLLDGLGMELELVDEP